MALAATTTEQPVNVSPYKGIKYVKVSKTDKDGVDRTSQLNAMQSLTIGYEDGTEATILPIVSRQEFASYFMFNIDYENFDTYITASDPEYVRYDYNLDLHRPNLTYNPRDRNGNFTSSVFMNPFQDAGIAGSYAQFPLTINEDSNGPNQQQYWGQVNGQDQPLTRFYWNDTPSIPMEYSASIEIAADDLYFFQFVLYKTNNTSGDNAGVDPLMATDTPQNFSSANIIPSYIYVENNNGNPGTDNGAFLTNNSFSGTTSGNFTKYTLAGVIDAAIGETVGVALRFGEPPPGYESVGSIPTSPNNFDIKNARLKIRPYYETNTNPQVMAPASSGGDPLVIPEPQIIVGTGGNENDVYELSNFNPVINNAVGLNKSRTFQEVDPGPVVPKNINPILLNIAEPAEVNDFGYNSTGLVNSKYVGSKIQSEDFNVSPTPGPLNSLGVPAADVGSTLFLNILGAGGQSPEVAAHTAIFFNKVITEDLKVFPTTDASLPIYKDLLNTFAPGEEVNINIFPEDILQTGYDPLKGVAKIVGYGELNTLLATSTGSGAFDFVNQLRFHQGSAQSEIDDYRVNATLLSDFTFNNLVANSTSFGGRIGLNELIFEAAAGNKGYTFTISGDSRGIYTFNPTDNAVNSEASVLFSYKVRITNNNPNNNNGTDGFVTIKSYLQKTDASGNVSILDQSVTITSIYAEDTVDIEYNNPSDYNYYKDTEKIELVLQRIEESHTSYSDSNVVISAAGTSMQTLQIPSPAYVASGGPFSGESYGEFGIGAHLNPTLNSASTSYTASPTSWLCFSEDLSKAVGLTLQYSSSQVANPNQGYNFQQGGLVNGTFQQINEQGNLGMSYTQKIVIPFIPQKGDQIRFGYDEDNVYTITDVILPEDNIHNNRLYVRINPRIVSIGDVRNNFILRRFTPDGKQLTIRKAKGSGGGDVVSSTITPRYLSSTLRDNFSNIVRELTDEGVL